jgi:hypothetical protein
MKKSQEEGRAFTAAVLSSIAQKIATSMMTADDTNR